MDIQATKIHHIWPAEGISDLPDDRNSFSLPYMRDLEQMWKDRREQIHDAGAFTSFNEAVAREWSIETGQIENLYDLELGITKTLIKEGFETAVIPPGSSGLDPETTRRILTDQQNALEGLFAFVKSERSLTTSYIKELHQAMLASQHTVTVYDDKGNAFKTEAIKGQWKTHPNYPQKGDTVFHYCPPEQVASEMDRLIELYASHEDVAPEVEAAWLHHRFTQIHPFQDGNGRVARALATLVLVKADLFPLIVSRLQKEEYLELLSQADSGDIQPFVYFIARGQQGHFRKAMRVAAVSSPPSKNSEEATRKLATVLGQRPDAIVSRLKDRCGRINGILGQYATQIAERNKKELVKEDGTADMSVGMSVREVIPAQVLEIAEILDHPIALPALETAFFVRAAGQLYSVRLVTAALEFDLEERLVSFAVLQYADQYESIDIPPIYWNKGHEAVSERKSRALVWVDQALTAGLDMVSRAVPE